MVCLICEVLFCIHLLLSVFVYLLVCLFVCLFVCICCHFLCALLALVSVAAFILVVPGLFVDSGGVLMLYLIFSMTFPHVVCFSHLVLFTHSLISLTLSFILSFFSSASFSLSFMFLCHIQSLCSSSLVPDFLAILL